MDWPAVAVRFALYADLALAFGLPAFALASPREAGAAMPLRALVLGVGLTGAALSVAGLLILATAMAGTPVIGVSRDAVAAVLTGTSAGIAWIVRMVALGSLAACSAWTGRRLATSACAVTGGVALATLAWTGHGAMDEGVIGWAHLVADVLHLLAAGMWSGALLALALLVFRPAEWVNGRHLATSHQALAGFSIVGTVVVAVIVATGLVNAWLLVGPANVGRLPATLYGQLLIAKLGVFGAMLALAAANRFRLVPGFDCAIASGDHRVALRALRRSLLVESGCAVVVLALVAWLGTLEPPVST